MTKIEHALLRDVVTVFHVIEAVQELYGDQAADKVTGRAIERAGYTLPGSAPVLPLNAPPAESGEVDCQNCAGNGEIVTDWDRYLHSHPGDTGDEAVAECTDCDGTGKVSTVPAPPPEPKPVWWGWYCPHCQRGVDGSEVTFHEQHLACGTYIGDAEPPPPEPAKAEVVGGIDPQRACRAAEAANTRFGQWMPQRWLNLFISAYGATPSTAPAAAKVPPSALNEPYAWWAETGTAGAGEGCNRPFWLRHEAIAYVRRHGGHVAPLFRRWSTATAAARSAAEEMRKRCAAHIADLTSGCSIWHQIMRGDAEAAANSVLALPLPGEEA